MGKRRAVQENELEKFLEVADRVMPRRGVSLTDKSRRALKAAYARRGEFK